MIDRNTGHIGVALSGGGYRAMLFHIGALRRLFELEALFRTDFFSSVSGGSIFAAHLALAWSKLDPEDTQTYIEYVEKPLLELSRRTLDVPSIISGLLLPWASPNQRLSSKLDEILFEGRTLQDLPEWPRFIFCASNLHTGSLMRFSRKYVADHRVGLSFGSTLGLAEVVAASAAFPPFLSPARIGIDPQSWTKLEGTPAGFAAWPLATWSLADGGVYDNLGLEPIEKRCATLLVSDGGGQFRRLPEISRDWGRHLLRVLGVIDLQVRNLRRRRLLSGYLSGEVDGAFWSIGMQPRGSGSDLGGQLGSDVAHRLAAVPTRLAAVPARLAREIVNWGYVAADTSVGTHWKVPNDCKASLPYDV